jgi:hypothetical protein
MNVLHFNDNENMQEKIKKNYDILYTVRPVVDIMNEFKIVYSPNHEVAVNKAKISFKGHFSFK